MLRFVGELAYRVGLAAQASHEPDLGVVEAVEGPNRLPPGHALDLGCGFGMTAEELRNRFLGLGAGPYDASATLGKAPLRHWPRLYAAPRHRLLPHGPWKHSVRHLWQPGVRHLRKRHERGGEPALRRSHLGCEQLR